VCRQDDGGAGHLSGEIVRVRIDAHDVHVGRQHVTIFDHVRRLAGGGCRSLKFPGSARRPFIPPLIQPDLGIASFKKADNGVVETQRRHTVLDRSVSRPRFCDLAADTTVERSTPRHRLRRK
jgi:hypothetical protein